MWSDNWTSHPERFIGVRHVLSSEAKLITPRASLGDLMAIPLNPTERLVKCVVDIPPAYPNPVNSVDWDKAFKSMYVEHRVKVAKWGATPQFTSLFDRIRFSLHRKLIQWKVIV